MIGAVIDEALLLFINVQGRGHGFVVGVMRVGPEEARLSPSPVWGSGALLH